MDKDNRAVLNFFKQVSDFSKKAKPWHQNIIWYTVKPDEAYDASKISQRVYGRRSEFTAVQAACGVGRLDSPLPVSEKIALPSEAKLYELKRITGFESIAENRKDRKPMWIDY